MEKPMKKFRYGEVWRLMDLMVIAMNIGLVSRETYRGFKDGMDCRLDNADWWPLLSKKCIHRVSAPSEATDSRY